VLPKFNADLDGADATAWCSTANVILAESTIKGSALVMALSAAMEGSASQWFAQICYPEITWAEFKELFVQRFASVETPAAMFLAILVGCRTQGRDDYQGETFSTTFDSGAECPLIKQKLSSKLFGKRINNVVMLKGIGNGSTCSTLQILSNVIINNRNIFHVWTWQVDIIKFHYTQIQ